MSAKQWLRIEYVDGTSETFTFPKQAKDDYELAQRLQEAMNTDRILLSADEQLHIVMLSAVKRVIFSPMPGGILPKKVIQGASQH